MQDRYTGDIGDFGKLGLLRVLQASGLSIGVNWYLVPDETHNDDGRFVQYLNASQQKYASLRQCDEKLWQELKAIVNSGKRAVASLQKEPILKATYYSQPLDFSSATKADRITIRKNWHEEALVCLKKTDLVFVDPDNGLIVPSAIGTNKENKFVTPKELEDYYEQGASIIYYQHKARLPDSAYLEKHKGLINSYRFPEASSLCLKFSKTSHRYYFFIIQPRHKEAITAAIKVMISSKWSDCFDLISF